MSKRDNKKLLNYTTEIDPAKTAGEIMGILAAKGAKSINMDYKDGEPIALSFLIEVDGVNIGFRLPCNYEGALRALRRTAAPRYQNERQAKRTAWRIVKDWVEAQMAIVECEQAELAEVFMGYAMVAPGRTLYKEIKDNPRKLLGSGDEESRPENVIEGRFLASGE